MIKDKLANTQTYYAISDRLVLGFEWLKKTDLNLIEDGKYEILGDDVYANVQTYETKDDALFEAHRKYIDIQYMIKGREKIGITDYQNCTTMEEYNSEKDIEFLSPTSTQDSQILEEGNFVVLFPHDAHQPSINPNKKEIVKKVVVKVLI